MSIFDLPEFSPYKNQWVARTRELNRRREYYDGTAYKDAFVGQGVLYGWLKDRLYTEIKPLYLPLSRAVDVDVGIIPAGWTLSSETSAEQIAARDMVFSWSKWTTEGVLYVHYGSSTGVVGLKVSDLRKEKKVVISPLDPTTFMLVKGSRFDTFPELSMQIERRSEDGAIFEYAEIITNDSVRTYKDGVPTGLAGRPAEYKNDLGFVPVIEIEHIDTGEALGDATFQKSIPLLDELNELASYLASIIQKHSEPQWAAFGTTPTDLEKSGDNVWFFPRKDSSLQPVVAEVDIAGVLEFVREIRDQVRGSLPELSFDELAKKANVATDTVILQLMELVIKVQRMRPNYDQGLTTALQAAGKAGASMGLQNIAVLNDPTLQMEPDREILPDILNQQESSE